MHSTPPGAPAGHVARRLASFRFAGRGVAHLMTEPNAKIHVLATLAVVALGAALRVTRWEWALLVVAITIVWVAEALNTAVERLADAVHGEPHPLIGTAKDLGAGAVLVAALGATVIACLVFGPRLAGLVAHG